MVENKEYLPALQREWLLIRIVLIVGFVLAIAAGTYLAVGARYRIVAMRTEAAARIAAQEKVANAVDQLCPSALDTAKGMGVIPNYAKLVEPRPRATNYRGRYLCVASTPSTLWGVIADISCFDVKSTKCLSLFAVTQKGGAIIYQRAK